MRFVYTKPERKEFVSDGTRIYTYLVADKQVIVSPAPGPNDDTTPALFLAGQADIARDFTATFTPLPGAAPGLIDPQARAQEGRPRLRVAGIGVDPTTAADPAPGGRRPAGRPVDVHLQQPEGKPGFGR